MSEGSQQDVDLVVRTIAQTAIDNEKYFGDLDSVLARGFEKVMEGWDDFDRTNPGTFLKKVGMMISSRIGGTSGPIWGTAFLRAGMAAGTEATLSGADVVTMLRSASDGIKARGQSDLGDKTLLDVLIPMTDRMERELTAGGDAARVLAAAAGTARESAEATLGMLAKRGRASYTGERSRDSVDAGAMAVAVIAENINQAWLDRQHGGAS
jgi:phosphoenolpyruvate---glycerone phosphotransferase subunit DhaL